MGLIVEQASGNDLHTFLHDHILDSSKLWFPVSEFENGRSFAVDQNPWEPWYNSGTSAINVFDPCITPPPMPMYNIVNKPYGGWNHKARVGQGAMVASAVPLLHLADNYILDGANIGSPLTNPIMEEKSGGMQAPRRWQDNATTK